MLTRVKGVVAIAYAILRHMFRLLAGLPHQIEAAKVMIFQRVGNCMPKHGVTATATGGPPSEAASTGQGTFPYLMVCALAPN